jgi:hypothetical protein
MFKSPQANSTTVRSSATPRSPRQPFARIAAALTVVVAVGAVPVVVTAQEAPSDPTTTTTTVPPETTTTTTTTTTVPAATTTIAAQPTTTVAIAPPANEPDATAPTTTTTLAPPVTAAGPVAPPARNVTVYPEQMEHILATIRYLESRGGYTLPPNKGNASGAYQFIGSTWNNYGGYAHAYLAPPEIQDERAVKDVTRFLKQFNNDVSMVPVMWYYPKAASEPALMDVVPLPQHGNRLTIREYQTRWLGVFSFISGQPIAPRLGPVDLSAIAGVAPTVPASHDGVISMSFPVLGPSRVAVPECDNTDAVVAAADGAVTSGPSRADIEAAGLCAAQAPGIVFGVKLQPVVAAADGVVTDVRDNPGSDEPISVTVTDASGTSYIYSGFNDDNLGTDDGQAPSHLRLGGFSIVGTTVRAGQVLGFMGDTDPLPVGVRADVPTDATVQIDPDAVAPHIRITMVDINGAPVEAFGPMIEALFRQTCHVLIGPWASTANGTDHTPTVIETTDTSDEIDSEWIITSTGQVQAKGWATLVNPGTGCGYAPVTAFGPGVSGSAQGLYHWLSPIKLPSDVWVALSLQDDDNAPGLIRR